MALKTAIVYYSAQGTTHQMARRVAAARVRAQRERRDSARLGAAREIERPPRADIVPLESEAELLALHDAARAAGLISALIQDAGLTEFGNVPTYTSVAIGPDGRRRSDAVGVERDDEERRPEAAGGLLDRVLGAIELGYMLDCAECIVTGALERKESRGAQFRLDFPERNDDEWLKHINLSVNGGDAPKITYSPVTMTQWEPQERKY